MNKLVILIVTVFIVINGCTNSKLRTSNAAAGQTEMKATSDFMGAYTINDATYGTKTTVTIEGDKQNIKY